MNNWNISEQAANLHRDALVCDMTLPWRTPGSQTIKDQVPRRLREAGFKFVSFTVAGDESSTLDAVRAVARDRAFLQSQSDDCILVDKYDDIVRAKEEGKVAIGLHFQGTVPVGRELKLVEVFYKLGIRHMLLAYNQKNFVADGCHEVGGSGLSRFGRELITEMNRVGMFVDVAHTSYNASMEAIGFSDRPVIVSHGNVWKFHEHPRCYRDDQIKAIAETGGVIGLTGISIFTGDDDASIEKFVDQIDYIAELVGPEYVGLGLDYIPDLPALVASSAAEASKWPKEGGYTRTDVKQIEPERVPQITQALLDRGYAETDIRLILGENWARLMQQIWK